VSSLLFKAICSAFAAKEDASSNPGRVSTFCLCQQYIITIPQARTSEFPPPVPANRNSRETFACHVCGEQGHWQRDGRWRQEAVSTHIASLVAMLRPDPEHFALLALLPPRYDSDLVFAFCYLYLPMRFLRDFSFIRSESWHQTSFSGCTPSLWEFLCGGSMYEYINHLTTSWSKQFPDRRFNLFSVAAYHQLCCRGFVVRKEHPLMTLSP
jgi:hypothetical protein